MKRSSAICDAIFFLIPTLHHNIKGKEWARKEKTTAYNNSDF
jgi:hypothetical protein